MFSLRLGCERVKVGIQGESQTIRDEQTPGAYDERRNAEETKIYGEGACTLERANKRDGEEMRRGANDRLTTQRDEDFIPGYLMVTASELNQLVSRRA